MNKVTIKIDGHKLEQAPYKVLEKLSEGVQIPYTDTINISKWEVIHDVSKTLLKLEYELNENIHGQNKNTKVSFSSDFRWIKIIIADIKHNGYSYLHHVVHDSDELNKYIIVSNPLISKIEFYKLRPGTELVNGLAKDNNNLINYYTVEKIKANVVNMNKIETIKPKIKMDYIGQYQPKNERPQSIDVHIEDYNGIPRTIEFKKTNNSETRHFYDTTDVVIGESESLRLIIEDYNSINVTNNSTFNFTFSYSGQDIKLNEAIEFVLKSLKGNELLEFKIDY